MNVDSGSLSAQTSRVLADVPATPPPLPASVAPVPPPGIGKVLLLCAVFYGLTIFAVIVKESLEAALGIKVEMAVALFFELVLAWSITLWISTILSERSRRYFYLGGSFPKAYFAPILLAGSGLAITLSEVSSLIPMPDFMREFFLELMQGNRAFVFLNLCVVAPVGEELFFRGFVFRSFLERYALRKAVLASSLIFALFHLNPWQIIVAFPAGLLTAWLVLRTGSLLPGMLAHFAINFTSGFLLFPLAGLFGVSQEQLILQDHFPWQVLVLGAGLAVAGLLWLFNIKGPHPAILRNDVVH